VHGSLQPGEIVVDSFAGGGGASLGIQWALGRGPDVAINHDREAIALHRANHPDSVHYPEDVWHVDPVEACAGRPVGLMWLSPDCKHFSKAKGGKPVSKKIRGLAWTAVRWAVAVRPRVIVLENVEEFQTWGPVSRETGRPCPARKGHTFRAFVRRLTALGYVVEWRELRACDYGAPTIRKRLFLVARSDGQPITWPAATHGKGKTAPWRTAAECIDWSLPCPSIFERAKPLADNTMRRIARGIQRYVIDAPRPFIVPTTHRGDARAHSIDEPLRTVTGAKRGEHALVVPYVVGSGGPAYQGEPRSADLPHRTILAESNAALIAPFLKPRYGEDPDPSRRGGLGQAPRARSLELPAPAIVPTGNGGDLVAAYLAKHNGGNEATGQMLDDPMHTIAGHVNKAIVTSHLTKFYGTARHGAQLELPMPTVTANDRGGGHIAEVRAFLISYYGTDQASGRLDAPAPTVTPRDRFGLVTVEGIEYQIADIGMRMLAPRELYRAQGFPDSYKIDIEFNGKPMTKTAQVRMCGNSVCPPLAAAIIQANLRVPATEERAA
jgi:DNA (cytosine-5)-methyltransferase 1